MVIEAGPIKPLGIKAVWERVCGGPIVVPAGLQVGKVHLKEALLAFWAEVLGNLCRRQLLRVCLEVADSFFSARRRGGSILQLMLDAVVKEQSCLIDCSSRLLRLAICLVRVLLLAPLGVLTLLSNLETLVLLRTRAACGVISRVLSHGVPFLEVGHEKKLLMRRCVAICLISHPQLRAHTWTLRIVE